jgi:hypothetical protein
MLRSSFARYWLWSGLLLVSAACGSRTELIPGRVVAAAAGAAGATTLPSPECVTVADCPVPPPDRCGSASCNDGVCALDLAPRCDDGDPCTLDACTNGACGSTDARVDADDDGFFARGTTADPNAALGCGNDCDDASPTIHPGAVELCDSFDNDCNGVVDDGTALQPSGVAPVRVSPLEAVSANGNGLAFDGESFGASLSSKLTTFQGQFRKLDARGKPLAEPQRVAHVNAESYGGALLWNGERYLTAYSDAREGNYEVFFDVLNRDGERLFEDRRVTNADGFSLAPSLAWTGAEALLVWEDRRSELDGAGDSSAVYGQRLSADGVLIGTNQRLSPPGVYGQDASMALSDTGVAIAFLSLEPGDVIRLRFMTTSRTLEQASSTTAIDFDDPDGVKITPVGDKYVVTFNQHGGSVIGPSIYGAVLSRNGVLEIKPQSMTIGAAHARSHDTYSYGDRFVMVWADDKDGPYQLYAQTFDQKLAPISARVRLTNDNADALAPSVAATADGGLGVLYESESTGSRQVFFTRLDCVSRASN